MSAFQPKREIEKPIKIKKPKISFKILASKYSNKRLIL